MLFQLHKAKFRATKRPPAPHHKGPLTLVNCEINRSYRSPVPLQCRGFLGRICIYGVRKKRKLAEEAAMGSFSITNLLKSCVSEQGLFNKNHHFKEKN